MFGTLGGPELFLIFVVALIVFGPRKLPDIGKSLGRMMSEFRRASNEFKSTIESEVESEKIRESMRIEPPKVTKSRTSPPGTAAKTTASAEAAANGGGNGEGEEKPSPSASEPGPTAPEKAQGDVATPPGQGPPEGDRTESDPQPAASAPAGETEPTTVSRQPPVSDSK